MAAPIAHDVIDQVRLAADIVEVVARKTKLTKKGKDFWGLCPFHGDSDPSMKVDRSRGTWHCFGCGEGGSVFDFVMKADSLSFPEAARSLASQFGVEIPEAALSPEQKKQRQKRDQILNLLEISGKFFQQQLMGANGQKARQYIFEQRQLSPEAARQFALGFAPDARNGLLSCLARQGMNEALAIEAGVAVARREGGGYDRFRNRVIFPIHDSQGRIISFGGRTLSGDAAKYMNGSETLLFKKSHTLYNLNQARNKAREKGRILLVEGYFDVVTLAAHGIGEVVAPMGTALTSQQVALLGKQAAEIILVFDGDGAGKRAATRALDLFLEAKLSPLVLWLPKGEDPDSLVRAHGIEALEFSLAQAAPLVKEVLDGIIRAGDSSSPESKNRLVAECGQVLAKIREPIVKSGYLDYLARELGLNPALVAGQLGQPRSQTSSRSGGKPLAALKSKIGLNNQEIILELALSSPQAARQLHEQSILEEIDHPDLSMIARTIAAMIEQGREPACGTILQSLAEAGQTGACSRISRLLETINRSQTPDMEQVQAHILAWRGKQAKTEKLRINRELAEAIAHGDMKKADSLRKMRGQLVNSTQIPA